MLIENGVNGLPRRPVNPCVLHSRATSERLAYKVGENEGKTNERKRIWDERYDDDYDSFSYDEEDDMCIAPEKDC